jgi:FMN phosphatase YigB (HAD superfamily)
MKIYRAVLFDLFGTVALFDRDRLPLFEWNGQTSRSTMGRLRLIYEEKALDVPFARFFSALSDVSRELGDERSRSSREIPSRHRFSQTLLRVGFASAPATHQLAEELSLAHMAILSQATSVPDAHVDFLQRVKQRYLTALVSNFDHGPTARHVLERSGADRHFQQILVSDEHGWRKPHPRIFSDALTSLGVQPEEALFVGDSPHDDIQGAKATGMDIAWVNAEGDSLPDNVSEPDYVIRAIPELQGIRYSPARQKA